MCAGVSSLGPLGQGQKQGLQRVQQLRRLPSRASRVVLLLTAEALCPFLPLRSHCPALLQLCHRLPPGGPLALPALSLHLRHMVLDKQALPHHLCPSAQ